ncbi:MAG: DoxX family protein [Saprospiraceae bacterium]|nr:DoxX family protein [Saprospiraceae bacterium]
MTSLSSLLIQFAVAGAILTGLTVWMKRHKNILWTFLQHFVGVWFVFSGLVKAVDPIGTAYKMEDYFGAFEVTFDGLNNVFKGLAPMFPWLAKHAIGFSITMIVFEIVLGIALIVGWRKKLTAWLFLLLMIVFTVLTGFTYLTGYVPTDANFFDFAKWGPYLGAQMRVQDCGCFGDFIKLDPKISFFKDLGLMVPALLFLWTRNQHELWTKRTREIIVGVSTLIVTLFCFQNTYWNLPLVDFRPFKVGSNVRERKELESSAKVDILGWILENTNTGEKVKFMEPEPNKFTYLKQYAAKDGWKVKEQIKTDLYVEKDGVKTTITKSKVSDFAVESPDNGEVTEDILNEEGYSLMVVAYKFYGSQQVETYTVQDTTWASDTIRVNKDSIALQRRVVSVQPKQMERKVFIPTPEYADYFTKGINPLAEGAQKAGWKVYAITTYGDAEYASDFARKIEAKYPFYRADDKLLKTIIRANPGVVVWKDGVVVDMYHHKHLPGFDQLSAKHK